MKKEYCTPEYEIEKFTIQDIITTSGDGTDTPDNPIISLDDEF